MQKIKILHIIKSLGRGGAEMLLPETLKLHNNDQFEFHYIYFLPWKNQLVETIENAGGKVTCFSASNNIKLLQQYPGVIRYCKKYEIDLIHCHLPWSGFLGRIIHFKIKLPVVYTEHNIQERYHFATKWLNKLTFNSQSLALGVSQDVSRSILEKIKPKIPVTTLLNGVNTLHFQKDSEKGNAIREKFDIPLDAVVLGNIAVFRAQKSIPVWLKAFKKIHTNHPEIYGILVGAGPLEDEIKQLVLEYGLQDRIILPGLETDTLAYFSAMDIFMMSSQFEGLPIALLEAMSSGCAIVSTKAGGVVEAIQNEIDGMLCEVGDWNCLAEKSLNLIENPGLRIEYQIASRNRVAESFSLSVMVKKLEEVYSDLFHNNPRAVYSEKYG